MILHSLSDNRDNVLTLHGKTQKSLDEDLIILKEWIKKEAHLPPTLLKETSFLEICLIRNKFSIEKVKSKIENYCTLKSQKKYLMEDFCGSIQPSKEAVFYHIIEPLMEGTLERLYFVKVFDEEYYDFARDFGITLVLRELTSRYDYNNGEIFIADYSACSSKFITKARVNIFVDAINMIFRGHSARIKQIHVINKWAHLLISFSKPFLPEKIISRLHSHDSMDTVKEFIPQKYFPKDYGGEQKSLQEIRTDWDKIFMENRELLEKAYNTMSHEELRINSSDTGIQGTFRSLSVD